MSKSHNKHQVSHYTPTQPWKKPEKAFKVELAPTVHPNMHEGMFFCTACHEGDNVYRPAVWKLTDGDNLCDLCYYAEMDINSGVAPAASKIKQPEKKAHFTIPESSTIVTVNDKGFYEYQHKGLAELVYGGYVDYEYSTQTLKLWKKKKPEPPPQPDLLIYKATKAAADTLENPNYLSFTGDKSIGLDGEVFDIKPHTVKADSPKYRMFFYNDFYETGQWYGRGLRMMGEYPNQMADRFIAAMNAPVEPSTSMILEPESTLVLPEPLKALLAKEKADEALHGRLVDLIVDAQRPLITHKEHLSKTICYQSDQISINEKSIKALENRLSEAEAELTKLRQYKSRLDRAEVLVAAGRTFKDED